jgi:uncharacterized protein YuzE
MKLNYDQEADALMISIRAGLVARSEEVDEGTLLDLDEHGNLLAIEVLRPARNWPLEKILASYEISDADGQALKDLWGADERYPFVSEPVFA